MVVLMGLHLMSLGYYLMRFTWISTIYDISMLIYIININCCKYWGYNGYLWNVNVAVHWDMHGATMGCCWGCSGCQSDVDGVVMYIM